MTWQLPKNTDANDLSLYRTCRAKKSLRARQVPGVTYGWRRLGTDTFRGFWMKKVESMSVQGEHGFSGDSILGFATDFSPIGDISQDRMPPRRKLNTDLMHPTCLESDPDKSYRLTRVECTSLEGFKIQLGRTSSKGIGFDQFSFCHIGNFSYPIGPCSPIFEVSERPRKVFLAHSPRGELLAKSLESSLISRNDERAAGHSVQPMRYSDERVGGTGAQLLDQEGLNARDSRHGLREQIDRFVDYQEPGVVDQDFDHAAMQIKKARNTGHVNLASIANGSLSASRFAHVPLKCNLGQEG